VLEARLQQLERYTQELESRIKNLNSQLEASINLPALLEKRRGPLMPGRPEMESGERLVISNVGCNVGCPVIACDSCLPGERGSLSERGSDSSSTMTSVFRASSPSELRSSDELCAPVPPLLTLASGEGGIQ
jgi:hypothetical protein